MSDNNEFFDWMARKETREIDIGDFAPARKGQKLSVWVNAPGVVQSLYGGRAFSVVETTDEHGKPSTETKYESEPPEKQHERMQRAVSILFEMPFDKVIQLDDTVLLWLYDRGWDAYVAYHAELRKNSEGD